MVLDKQSDLSNRIPPRFALRYLVFLSLYISSTYTSYFPGQKKVTVEEILTTWRTCSNKSI